ncbi:MAG: hypothetical protein WD025_05550 [Bacteriovoracaceae bacterium]
MKFILAFLFLLAPLGFSYEGAFDPGKTLTEEEEHEADNYIHQGLADTAYHEMCEDNDDCFTEQAWTSKTGKTLETMMPMVSKMYGMFGGLAGAKLNANVSNDHGEILKDDKGDLVPTEGGKYARPDGSVVDADSDAVKNADNKTQEKPDYCSYIPTATETVAATFQQSQNEQTQQNYNNAAPEAQQKASFEALAKMHKDRAETAKYQYAGWGSTAGCYAAMAAFSAVAMDVKTTAKMVAAGVIAGFYVAKEKAHNERADMLKDMAKQLPGAGDCNPHTETTCFCAEETSYGSDPTNYMKYCVAEALRRDDNRPGFPCATKDGKPDPECGCKKRNNCLKTTLAKGALELGLNAAQMKDPMAGIEPFSSGYGSGKLGDITARNLARAKRELGKIKTREKINLGGNKEAQKIAKQLFDQGVPKALAASVAKQAAASNSVTPPGASGSMAALKPKSQDLNQAFPSSKGKKRMKSGGSVKSKSKKSSYAANPYGRKRRARSGTTGAEIIEFAERATSQAEKAAISKDKGRPIFEIITYRYKMRAWKEFEESMKEATQEDSK